MNKLAFTFFLLLGFLAFSQAQNNFAENIKLQYKIPELEYAVITSDSVLEINSLGVQRINTNYKATINDRFRIGSNTKVITSYITELLVKKGKLNWDTKFFELYPELKKKSNKAYYDLTLKDLVTFRAPIIGWTYTYQVPTDEEISGSNRKQRYKFISWVLQQNPVTEKQTVYWSNPGYVMVGLMLEKVTGKKYETLVNNLGKELGIEFDFGQPNYKDENQPWGHDKNWTPEKPALNHKLNWLSSAGNINVSLPDYCKFIQLQLKGLEGKSKLLSKEDFSRMHFGLPEFAYGWNWFTDEKSKFLYSYHEGNPGTFLTKTYICNDTKKAFIIFANVQSEEAEKGLYILLDELKKKYGS